MARHDYIYTFTHAVQIVDECKQKNSRAEISCYLLLEANESFNLMYVKVEKLMLPNN